MTALFEPDLGTPAVSSPEKVSLTIDGREVTVPALDVLEAFVLGQ